MSERQQTRDEFEAVLRRWEAEGFVLPGWGVYWSVSDGAHQVTFQTAGNNYALAEDAMESYIAGVADRAGFRETA